MKSFRRKILGVLLINLVIIPISICSLEQGVIEVTVTKDKETSGTFWEKGVNGENAAYIYITRTMYSQTEVAVNIDHTKELKVQWLMRETPCYTEYAGSLVNQSILEYYRDPSIIPPGQSYKSVEYVKSNEQHLDAEDKYLKELIGKHPTVFNVTTTPAPPTPKPTGKTAVSDTKKSAAKAPRQKRAAPTTTKPTIPGNTTKTTPTPKPKKNPYLGPDIHLQPVYHAWKDGVYLFILKITPVKPVEFKSATVKIYMRLGNTTHSLFLSPVDWPLLPFYATMCVVYVIYGLVWLVLSLCNWRDILRVQFVIGGVIFLGMLEKAVFLAEYEHVNSTGESVRGAAVFAELVSCLKRSVARMLVVIVSLGFGIVKPRLGPTLHKVLAMGGLYFILSAVEGCLRTVNDRGDANNRALMASIPLAVLDAAICWWVFTGLLATTRTLRLRRNVVKLSLYRHFTNTLIFAVVASVVFMIWSIKQHKLSNCLSDWKEIWVDDAFWHLLFSIILLVIMVLWRPSANNQRYAFTPLLDEGEDPSDDERHEPTVQPSHGAHYRPQKQASPGPRQDNIDDKLKWIEDNVPSSGLAETALPSLIESDEEIMTQRFEVSKME